MKDAAAQNRLPAIFLIGLVVMCLWPRFFFIGVFGKGIGIYYVVTYALVLDVIRRLATSRNLQYRFRTTIGASSSVFVLFLSYYAVRIYADIQGETALHSLASTAIDLFGETSWFFIAIVYLNSIEKIAQAYRVIIFCAVMFFVFAGIEYAFQTPLLTVLRLNQFAVGDKFVLAAIDRASSGVNEFRIKGIFVHPIILGQIAGACAPLAFHAWRFGRGPEKYAGAIVLLGQLALPSLTLSRSALVSPIIALLVYFVGFTLQVNNRRRFVALVAAVLVMAVASPLIIDAAATVIAGQDKTKQSSTRFREIQLYYGENAIKHRPLFGYGSDLSIKYAGIQTNRNVRTIDNYYLSEAVDHGLLGLGFFSGLLLMFFYFAFTTTVREQSDILRSLFAAGAALVATPAVGLSVVTLSTGLSFIFFGAGSIIAWRGVLVTRARLLRRHSGQAFGNPRMTVNPASL